MFRLNNRLNNKNRLNERERAAACAHYLEEDDLSDCTSEKGKNAFSCCCTTDICSVLIFAI